VGAFVGTEDLGTEGLHGHIYMIWVSEKNRLFQSHDVKFCEGREYVSKEWSASTKNKKEIRTYRAIILGNKEGETKEWEN